MKNNVNIYRWVVAILTTLVGQNLAAQQYKASTEIQNTFIDITGLFGVDEPASITQFSFVKKGFGLDVYHAFSLQSFGKTIQSIVTPAYQYKLDKSGKFSLKAKVEIANLEASGGGFVRPGVHFIYKPNTRHTLNFGTWIFSDMRNKENYPKRLNGHTFSLSYTHTKDLKKWSLTQETRVLYVDIINTLQVGGLFQNVQFTYKPINLYFGGNAVYSFYRSDKKNQLFWNLTLGEYF